MKHNLKWITLIGFATTYLVIYAFTKEPDFFISTNIFIAAAFLAGKEQ